MNLLGRETSGVAENRNRGAGISFRGGVPPGGLPRATYNPPFILTKNPGRRCLLYVFTVLAIVVAVGSSREAFQRWNWPTYTSGSIQGRHLSRDGLLNGCFNLFVAFTLVRFDRRRVAAERGLVWSATTRDWLAHPVFTAEGRIRWSVSFWHSIIAPMAFALALSLVFSLYDAIEVTIYPPPGPFSAHPHVWFETLIGALSFTAIGTCLIHYDRRRLRREGRAASGNCFKCGYDLRASPDRCPECGAPKIHEDAPVATPR